MQRIKPQSTKQRTENEQEITQRTSLEQVNLLLTTGLSCISYLRFVISFRFSTPSFRLLSSPSLLLDILMDWCDCCGLKRALLTDYTAIEDCSTTRISSTPPSPLLDRSSAPMSHQLDPSSSKKDERGSRTSRSRSSSKEFLRARIVWWTVSYALLP